MGEFPFPFGPFPWWYVLGFLFVLAVGGIVLNLRDRLKGVQAVNNHLNSRLGEVTTEAVDALRKLAVTQRNLESITNLNSDLIRIGASSQFDITVVEHVWHETPPKPFVRANEKVIYAERMYAFLGKNRINGETFSIKETIERIDVTTKIRFLPQENVAFSLNDETESFLSDKDAYYVKFRELE